MLKVVEQLPRTATGKLVRDRAALLATVAAAGIPATAIPGAIPGQRAGEDVTDGATDLVAPAPVKEGNR